MNWYIQTVINHPILTAVIQFAILGTLGEICSKMLAQRSKKYPFGFAITLWKMVVWSILAVYVKFAFLWVDGIVRGLVEQGSLPQMEHGSIGFAFAKSVLANIPFGMFLVVFHRFLDNLVIKVKNWKNLDKSMLSLIWFWIPAHTVTFSLDKVYQIGLAALWSLVLGFILGSFNRK